VIVAAKRICIANCRECVFFLGVNQQPLMIGDNHKLQVNILSIHSLFLLFLHLCLCTKEELTPNKSPLFLHFITVILSQYRENESVAKSGLLNEQKIVKSYNLIVVLAVSNTTWERPTHPIPYSAYPHPSLSSPHLPSY
jgi:hypothetical protein